MITVRIGVPLRRHTGGAARVDAGGDACDTVESCLAALGARFPDLRGELWERPGTLSAAAALYVNRQDIRLLDGMETQLRDGDELSILLPIAGGGDARGTQPRRPQGHQDARRA